MSLPENVRPLESDNGWTACYLVSLPDGCTPGRFEAAREFAQAFDAIHRLHPVASFNYVPFDHEGGQDGAVTAYLVIVHLA